MSQKILNISEASVLLSRSEDWTRKHAASGFIKGTKINERSWVFFESDLLEHIKQNTKSFTQIKRMIKEELEKSYSPTTLNGLAYIQKNLVAFNNTYHMHNVDKAITFVDLAIAEIEAVLAGVK